MIDRDEAIKIIADYEINGCGYCHQGGEEVEEAFAMAIEALKAQEPRVMTLEEVQALEEHKNHAWVEWREEHEQTIVACLPVYCHSGNFYCNDNAIDFEVPFDTFSFAWNEYLTCWRCWTSRPTDEQREAVKWDG